MNKVDNNPNSNDGQPSDGKQTSNDKPIDNPMHVLEQVELKLTRLVNIM